MIFRLRTDKNMSKGALKLQYFANNILKNAIKNSQRQNEKNLSRCLTFKIWQPTPFNKDICSPGP